MRRGLKYGLCGLLGVLLVLALALTWMLASTAGSRWALARVPGLQVSNFSGQLGGQWRAEQLRWQQGERLVDVRLAEVAWSPQCLLRLTLCVERLQIERIELRVPPGEEAGDAPLRLPQMQLPLAVQLGEVHIGSLQLNGAEQLQGLQLAARWTREGVQIDSLRLQRGDFALDLSGQLRPSGDWPLSLAGKVQLPAPEQQDWQLDLQIVGDVQNSLQVTADSAGYLTGRLRGAVQPLADNVPASLQLHADGFKVGSELPDTLRLNKIELTANGDLADGYRVSGNAELPGEGGPLALTLQGLLKADGAEIAGLSLSASAEQQLRLSGQLDWREGFGLDGRFDWQDFPWQRLYPDVEQPPVALRRLSGELAYRDGNYLGHFAAALDGPAGAFNLESPLSGDLQQLHLPDLQLRAGQGRADGQLTLGFADGLRWDARLQLHDLDPAYWLAELPGTLGGPLHSQGQMNDQQLSLNAQIDLKGRLRGQPAQLRAEATGSGEHWLLPRLDLRLGDNRIDGSGELNQRLSGQLRLNLPRLGQLWPQLQGQLQGQLDLAGSLQAPQGQLSLQGQRLAYTDQRLQRVQLDATLDSAQHARVELDAQGIVLGETELGRLTASGQGDRRQQRLQLKLDGPLLQSALALAGRLDQGAWRGQLSSAEVQSGGQDWRLQQPAALVRLANGQLSLAAHCWRSAAASLCGEDQRLLPEPRLRYRLRDFPLDSLAQWLPKDFAWQGLLNAEVQLDLPVAGPSGQVVLDAGSGTWRIRDRGQWLDFAYDSLRLESQLSPQRIDTRLDLRGPKIGELLLQARLDPRPANKTLAGDFRLSGLDLALAQPFLPMVEHMAGRLDGSGNLSGSLLAPYIDGRLQLRGGQLSGGQLPMDVEALQVDAQIAGDSLQLSGGWRSGDQGQASLAGELSWRSGLQGELRLSGSHLPVNVEPYAQLEVEPDLTLRIAAEQLSITGEVLVPRGKIVIRELPPSIVKVSDDALIVGRESVEPQPLAIAMDIDVEVGQERLSFSGFGLNADLTGRVHVGNDLDTRGELSLNNGRYRAYGQRLTLRRARLLFAGPIDQPYLDVEAIRRVDSVVAGLRLSGNAEQPTSEVFSEPAMSQQQALSYLVLGRPLGQSSGDNNMLAQAALAMGVAGSAPLTGGLAQGLGVKDFQLDTEGSGISTSVVASGSLSERLSLRYGVGVFEPVNTIALRYELSKRLYLEAASGLASSLDLFYRRDF
ncbi:MAG: translocation/assembly module TamB domain-containing protein [Pseudomonas sp.]|uniref:translocation/assembly module TamB domain-containing protein n=1 Tax=Pseudomonas sp. TaxID=306 RepID=UPI00299E83E8|nr:translocation/assembly module TamB domain-containing protein [Pseudomonas sp.]MDX1725665.1 translocation/assembly module TamB domain-containing protein [Pseudomonas sp.]